jgi:hypothetical protein
MHGEGIMAIKRIWRIILWAEPLITDIDQIDNKKRNASLPKLTAIALTSLFIKVVLYALKAPKELPNLMTVIDGLMVALITIWGIVFAHKFVLLRNGKMAMSAAGTIEGGDNGGNGTDKQDTPTV